MVYLALCTVHILAVEDRTASRKFQLENDATS
jgi:hypothetical protein